MISAALAAVVTVPAKAEILAMMNYETKSADSLKALKLQAPAKRSEGIMVMDVDPKSENFGKVLMQIPLPDDLIAHHIFYDRTQTKAYITALGKSELRVMDLTRFPYRIKVIKVPGCTVLEDVILSEDNQTWYLTCMGSSKIVIGDVATDKIRTMIDAEVKYPHGLAVHTGIDRYLTTSTVRASDLGDAGDSIAVYKASTNEPLGTIRVSNKPSPAGVAPVEILFVPGSNPPVAYVTNMYGGGLWTLTWNGKDFDAAEAFNFADTGDGVPLEMYFNQAATRMYVTTAKPGRLHVFALGDDPAKPKLLKSLTAAEGAHHVAVTKDEKLAFVQNTLLNLPGMSDGEITVVDLEKNEVVARIDTLKKMGLNPNLIVLLPKWNSLFGH